MLEFIVLGSSASLPTKERALPSYAIRSEGDLFLLDCGEGTQRQLLNLNLSFGKIKAIFISHLHLDHFLGLFGLAHSLRLLGLNKKIIVFGPKGLDLFFKIFNCQDIYDFKVLDKWKSNKPFFSTKNCEFFYTKASHGQIDAFAFLIKEKDKICFYEQKAKKLGLKGTLFSKIQKEKKLKINSKTIYLKDVSYIKKGKSIAYSGDTIRDRKLIEFFKNVDLLVHDCTFDDSLANLAKEKHHSTVLDAAMVAKKAKAKALLLTHISARYSKDPSVLLNKAKKIFENSTIAYDGLRIILK